MRFELEPYNRDVPDDDLLSDLRRVAQDKQVDSISCRLYEQFGRYHSNTIMRHFGSWNVALECAGLSVKKAHRIPDEKLLSNLESVWRRLGRQPRHTDLDSTTSEISASAYTRRFGSWRKALEAFVMWVNADSVEPIEPSERTEPPTDCASPRDPNLRLRFQVMRRDRFRCCHCGRSPSSTSGLELHVDHVKPWSEGGKTILENLQTLCDRCNLGKSNLLQ